MDLLLDLGTSRLLFHGSSVRERVRAKVGGGKVMKETELEQKSTFLMETEIGEGRERKRRENIRFQMVEARVPQRPTEVRSTGPDRDRRSMKMGV